jgi:hypothetical protein
VSGFVQLPPPHHYETETGIPVVGWWLPDSDGQYPMAVIHVNGHFAAISAPYRLRRSKMETSPNSAPEPYIDEYKQGRKPDTGDEAK